jgi:hypothetical protein
METMSVIAKTNQRFLESVIQSSRKLSSSPIPAYGTV